MITLSTIQLDYYLPQRFRARYTDADGKERTCVLIHRGLLGTYERFISILLEQYKGDLPLWINPRQIMIIPTTLKDKEIIDYSKSIFKRLKEEEIEVAINLGEENLNKKILLAQKERFKLTAVIGRRELETGSLSIRELGTQESNIYQVEELIKMIKTVEPR